MFKLVAPKVMKVKKSIWDPVAKSKTWVEEDRKYYSIGQVRRMFSEFAPDGSYVSEPITVGGFLFLKGTASFTIKDKPCSVTATVMVNPEAVQKQRVMNNSTGEEKDSTPENFNKINTALEKRVKTMALAIPDPEDESADGDSDDEDLPGSVECKTRAAPAVVAQDKPKPPAKKLTAQMKAYVVNQWFAGHENDMATLLGNINLPADPSSWSDDEYSVFTEVLRSVLNLSQDQAISATLVNKNAIIKYLGG
jgi:hypothetical protein